MKKLLLLTTVAMLAAVPAKADTFNFTVSDGHGTGPFGTIATSLNADGSTHVDVEMAPNWIIENGGDAHHAFTFSTTLAGSITNLSANFTLLPYSATGSYDNKPFTGFTDAIVGNNNCATPGNGGCGPSLMFDISNYGSFTTANPFGGNTIYAAVDLCQKSLQPGECTFVAGLGDNPTPGTHITPTPLPGAAWMFGAGLGGLGLLMRRRRKQNQEAA